MFLLLVILGMLLVGMLGRLLLGMKLILLMLMGTLGLLVVTLGIPVQLVLMGLRLLK